MKNIFASLLFLLFGSLSAQQSSSFTFLDYGGVRARVYSNGELFQDKSNFAADYEVPKNSGNSTIYASAFWMSSKNASYNAAAYESFGNDGFFTTGPVDIVNQMNDTSAQFQRLWKIEQATINNHIQYWNSSTYTAPAEILDWPGNGNGNTAKTLAPFKDLDNDSIYEPLDGEYPIIKGDQAVFLIFNTYKNSRDTINYSYGTQRIMRIEGHVMLYAYATNNQAVLNSVFVNVKLFNRSNSSADDYSDFRFSVYTDIDLGNPTDDYIGTDTSRNLFYAYNGDQFDESFGGNPGYGNNLATQAVKFLDYDLKHSVYFTSGSGPNGDPEKFLDNMNFQRSKWKDSSNLYYSGNGINFCIDSNKQVDFMFDGNPLLVNDTTQWTENNPCVFSNNIPPNASGDRRMVGGPDLPTQFNHGTSMEFNYAYIFAQDTGVVTNSIRKLFATADSVQAFFDDSLLTVIINEPKSKSLDFTLYPNPTNNLVTIQLKSTEFMVDIYTIAGNRVKSITNSKEISVGDLARGIYFLRVSTTNSSAIKKLVITD